MFPASAARFINHWTDSYSMTSSSRYESSMADFESGLFHQTQLGRQCIVLRAEGKRSG